MSESTLDRILRSLAQDEADALRRVLLSDAPHTEVAEILSRHGHPVSEAAVRRWRRSA